MTTKGTAFTSPHSFKGLALYLLNDTDEMQSDDPSRVDWTETGNLLTDDIEKAARVMAWTDSHADDLKASAGISNAGARPSAGAVYHYTLAWAVCDERISQPGGLAPHAQRMLVFIHQFSCAPNFAEAD